ncbi:MAG: sigma-70 family RNA polymerase sigma factor [Negativibacillus sp.]|nr:sigma-70 family RNA polymerase sigma factor [Negativibacillus sp.]
MSKQPCKPSDEQLVLSARSGDTEQLAQLIVRFLPDIRAKASRYTPVGLEQEDLIQEGLIGLLQAVKGYDSTRNASFATFASRCILFRILGTVRLFLEQKHLPLNNYLPIDSAQVLAELSDRDGDPLEAYLKQEEEQLRRQKIKTLLSGLEQETLTLYLNGLSYEEMAQQLGCATKAVDNALQRVRRKLRDSTR